MRGRAVEEERQEQENVKDANSYQRSAFGFHALRRISVGFRAGFNRTVFKIDTSPAIDTGRLKADR
jgi:hypothetical protein